MPNCCATANVVGRVRRLAKARSSRLELPNARCTFHFPSPLPTCAWREILPRQRPGLTDLTNTNGPESVRVLSRNSRIRADRTAGFSNVPFFFFQAAAKLILAISRLAAVVPIQYTDTSIAGPDNGNELHRFFFRQHENDLQNIFRYYRNFN